MTKEGAVSSQLRSENYSKYCPGIIVAKFKFCYVIVTFVRFVTLSYKHKLYLHLPKTKMNRCSQKLFIVSSLCRCAKSGAPQKGCPAFGIVGVDENGTFDK